MSHTKSRVTSRSHNSPVARNYSTTSRTSSRIARDMSGSIPDVGSHSTRQRGEALADRVIGSKHAPHPCACLAEICAAGVGDCLDVGPVPGAIEQRLEDNQ